MDSPRALFVRDDNAPNPATRIPTTLIPTALTRGPWDHGFLHGGAVCGAVGWAIEAARPDDTLVLARLTVEIRAMVPLAPLRLSATVSKPGRRTRVIDATVELAGPGDGDGESHGKSDGESDGKSGDNRNDRGPLVRATSQWVAHHGRASPASGAPRPATPRAATPRPEQAADPGARTELDYPRPGFNCDAVELRPIRGTTEDPGPGLIWARLRHPVVDGEATSPLLNVLALSDLGIAVGWDHSPSGADFINPDVTVQLNRYPVNEWVLLASRVHGAASGVGFCETVLSDDAGLFGRVLQTLVEAPIGLNVTSGPPDTAARKAAN